jgi:biotin-(acetyl-CoA carboxylase) ligase
MTRPYSEKAPDPSNSPPQCDLPPPALCPTFDVGVVNAISGQSRHGFHTYFAPTIDSTMNLLSYCENQLIPLRPGLVLVAGYQTHGVGRTGAWESSAQQRDVTMSIVLRDTDSAENHLLLHIATTLAVARALDHAVGLEAPDSERRPNFRIKLPNDVRVDHGSHFGKICGSLGVGILNPDIKAEHHLLGWRYPDDYLIMGVGINLSNEVLEYSAKLRFPASSLEYVSGRLFPREVIIGLVLGELDRTLTWAEEDRDRLLNEARHALALGHDGSAILDTRNGFSSKVAVIDLNSTGLTFRCGGETQTIPLEMILRLYPDESA